MTNSRSSTLTLLMSGNAKDFFSEESYKIRNYTSMPLSIFTSPEVGLGRVGPERPGSFNIQIMHKG